MGRKKGTPAYAHKTVGPKTYITTKLADAKLKAAERRTGKSQSDIVTHCILATADSIVTQTPLLGRDGVFAGPDSLDAGQPFRDQTAGR